MLVVVVVALVLLWAEALQVLVGQAEGVQVQLVEQQQQEQSIPEVVEVA